MQDAASPAASVAPGATQADSEHREILRAGTMLGCGSKATRAQHQAAHLLRVYQLLHDALQHALLSALLRLCGSALSHRRRIISITRNILSSIAPSPLTCTSPVSTHLPWASKGKCRQCTVRHTRGRCGCGCVLGFGDRPISHDGPTAQSLHVAELVMSLYTTNVEQADNERRCSPGRWPV